VQGRQSTDLDGSRSLFTLGNMKEFPELIQGRWQNNFIVRAGKNMEYWHSNDLADNLRINHNNMPDNGKLYDNAIVIILHDLKIGLK